jgi:hypothetical protein
MKGQFAIRGFGSGWRTIERSLLLVIGIVVGVFLAVGASVSITAITPNGQKIYKVTLGQLNVNGNG